MKNKFLPAITAMAILAGSCSKDNDKEQVVPPVKGPQITITEPSGGFATGNMQWVRISADVKNDQEATYLWKLGADTLSTTKNLLHIFAKEGSYTLSFSAKNNEGENKKEVVVQVTKKTYVNGVAKVLDFQPAPGQFVNKLPEWEAGDNEQAMMAKAATALKEGRDLHLGGFGGYVVMGFDHTILNTPDAYSFLVKGNAFTNWAEPGIIEVSYDANGNGLADDEWYEIAGSEYNSPKTIKNYQITYYKPDENKVRTPNNDYPFVTDSTYIRWEDNQGKSGYLSRNSFNEQPYYPQWKGASMTFKGTKLTDENIVDKSGIGQYFIHPPFAFGYADNWGNADEKAKIRISWAVDKAGKPVKLKGVDFIKVYTAMRAEAGWLGEVSTEISGVTDLNL